MRGVPNARGAGAVKERKADADALDTELPLVEYFRSVQGEGTNAGRDAWFIRFAGCNLDCVFADGAVCDTPWQQVAVRVQLGALVEWMDAGGFRKPGSMVVLTGGEPTLHPAFDTVVATLRRQGRYVAVETNGTRWRRSLPDVNWITVSPKDDTGQHQHVRTGTTTLDDALVRHRPNEYRHVIAPDSPIPLLRPVRPSGARYLSPAFEADGSGYLRSRPVEGAVERCLEIIAADPAWRLSLQVHKLIGVR